MSQFPMTNQWMPQQWGVYQGAQTAPQWGVAPQAAPQWDMQRMAQDPQYAQRLQQMRQMQSAQAPQSGSLMGQQSGGASWPGGLTGTQSNYPWYGGAQQTNSVNGAVYSEMPAYEMPNWFNNMPWDVTQWQNLTPEQLQATVSFNEMAMPWTQMAQNYNQWQNEFNQNAYQWGNEFDWKKTGDQFAMDMATRQQDTSESQWGSEFGLKTREQDDLNKWRDTQATLEREKMVSDQENQALAAWGRKLRPNTRWM